MRTLMIWAVLLVSACGSGKQSGSGGGDGDASVPDAGDGDADADADADSDSDSDADGDTDADSDSDADTDADADSDADADADADSDADGDADCVPPVGACADPGGFIRVFFTAPEGVNRTVFNRSFSCAEVLPWDSTDYGRDLETEIVPVRRGLFRFQIEVPELGGWAIQERADGTVFAPYGLPEADDGCFPIPVSVTDRADTIPAFEIVGTHDHDINDGIGANFFFCTIAQGCAL